MPMGNSEETRESDVASTPPLTADGQGLPEGEPITRTQFTGRLFFPTRQGEEPPPAIVVLPPPEFDAEPYLEAVVQALGDAFALLVVEWPAFPTFPDALAVVPAAVSFLISVQGIDPACIGVMGTYAGGDLVLRAACSDPELRSVVAVEPLLDARAVRAGLLSKLRRVLGAEWLDLVKELETLELVSHLAGRPVAVVYGEEEDVLDLRTVQDMLGQSGLGGILHFVEGADHASVVLHPQTMAFLRQWFDTTLCRGE